MVSWVADNGLTAMPQKHLKATWQKRFDSDSDDSSEREEQGPHGAPYDLRAAEDGAHGLHSRSCWPAWLKDRREGVARQ